MACRRAQAPDLLDLKDLIRFNPASSKGAYNPLTSRDQSINRRKYFKSQEARKLMSSVEDRVKKIVVEQLGVSEEQVTPDASFVDDLGADSLDTVELVMALEEEFDAEIPDDEAEKITTVKQAVEFIQANASG